MRCLLFVRAITGAWNHIPNPTHQRVPPSQSHGCHAPHRFSFPSIREQHDTNTILVHAADCGTNLDSWARRFMSKICTKLDPVDLEPRLTPTKLCLSLGGSCDRSINHQETGWVRKESPKAWISLVFCARWCRLLGTRSCNTAPMIGLVSNSNDLSEHDSEGTWGQRVVFSNCESAEHQSLVSVQFGCENLRSLSELSRTAGCVWVMHIQLHSSSGWFSCAFRYFTQFWYATNFVHFASMSRQNRCNSDPYGP